MWVLVFLFTLGRWGAAEAGGLEKNHFTHPNLLTAPAVFSEGWECPLWAIVIPRFRDSAGVPSGPRRRLRGCSFREVAKEAKMELVLRKWGVHCSSPALSPRSECGRRTDRILDVRSSLSKKTFSFHFLEKEPQKDSSGWAGIALLLPLLFEFVFPMLTTGCPQTWHSKVAPEMLCFYTTCDPSRNVKLPLNLLYWLNQQVWSAGNWSLLCPFSVEIAKYLLL